MNKKFRNDDNSVVVIVGSGAGGGTLAHELAKCGVNCVLLEAGKHFSPAEFENDEWSMFGKLTWLDKRVAVGANWDAATYQPHLPAWIVKGVGGSTIHWAGVSLRFQPHEFKALSTYGKSPGTNPLDWPLSYADLAPFYDLAEKKLGVAGSAASGMPALPLSNHCKVIEAGARKIGYTQFERPLAINSRPNDGRPGCQQIGFCLQGCKLSAKWSTLYTDIPRAVASGRVELRAESMALRIEHDKSGKASGVLYVDRNGRRQFQQARLVCIAGNAIESPRLLLNSASPMFPQGLANSSGQVGCNYMNHATGYAFAIHDKPVYMYRGNSAATIISDEAHNDPRRGFVGGYHLEGLSFGFPFVAAFMNPGAWGRDHAALLEMYDHMSGVTIVGEDQAVEANCVTLHATEKDQHGLAIPVVTKNFTANDTALLAHGLARWDELSAALGARRVLRMPAPPAPHNLGTLRMSARRRDGVVNQWGQAHDVKNLFVSDGSQFTSSGAANPTLTIVALAIRQAAYIAGAMRRREL